MVRVTTNPGRGVVLNADLGSLSLPIRIPDRPVAAPQIHLGAGRGIRHHPGLHGVRERPVHLYAGRRIAVENESPHAKRHGKSSAGTRRTSSLRGGRGTRRRCRSAPASHRSRPTAPGRRSAPARRSGERRYRHRSAPPPSGTAAIRHRSARCWPTPCSIPCSRPSRSHCLGHSAARSTNVILTSSSVRTGGTTAPAGATRSAICRIQSTNARCNSAARGSRNQSCSASRTRSTSSNDRLCSSRISR